jgi:hypothetical protein
MSSLPTVQFESNQQSEAVKVKVVSAEQDNLKLERRRLVARARRLARAHGMRMTKSRCQCWGFKNKGEYRLTATVVIAGPEFQLTPNEIIQLCAAMDGGQ